MGKQMHVRNLLSVMPLKWGHNCLARTGAAALTVVLGVAVAVGGMTFGASASTRAVSPAGSATMHFSGALNLLGLLDSLTVSPSEVSVRSGGSVTFSNDSGVGLTLFVAGQSNSIPAHSSHRFDFPGGSSEQRFGASVTPLNAPVLGDALRSTGTVRVAAAPREDATAPSASPWPPSASPGPTASPLPHLGHQNTSPANAENKQDPRQAEPQWQFGQAPSVNNLLLPDPPQRGVADTQRGVAAPSGALSSFTTDGHVGLLILVALVLLIGVTSAAMRVVMAKR
ncbi:MAG TPA: hypothetical protein VHU91_09560, partial [Mycobacteriales bacterium]|nr:hypothetical protein [Mycobacteriales bacterium]